MPAIRNIAVAKGRLSTPGYVSVYVVPAGSTLILKSALLMNSGAVAIGGLNLRLQNNSGGPTYAVLAMWTNIVAGTFQDWSGWTVLNDGDAVYVQFDTSQVDYWIAGALLPHS